MGVMLRPGPRPHDPVTLSMGLHLLGRSEHPCTVQCPLKDVPVTGWKERTR